MEILYLLLTIVHFLSIIFRLEQVISILSDNFDEICRKIFCSFFINRGIIFLVDSTLIYMSAGKYQRKSDNTIKKKDMQKTSKGQEIVVKNTQVLFHNVQGILTDTKTDDSLSSEFFF